MRKIVQEYPENNVIEWVTEAIFYQIFPDRFARSENNRNTLPLEAWESPPTHHGFKGGTMEGIMNRLDYLTDLGVNVLYLTPIFSSPANHRYHTSDYFTLDPLLGNQQTFDKFVTSCHKEGIRIILDAVFNHCGRGFYPFVHCAENGDQSPYRDWFLINRFPLTPYNSPKGQHGYHAWWDIPALPKLNIKNRDVRNYLWDVATYWISKDIDGWRFDVPDEMKDRRFWQTLRKRVKKIAPDAYLTGEVWFDASYWLKGDIFDGVMNYQLTKACYGFFIGDTINTGEMEKTPFRIIEPINAENFAKKVTDNFQKYPFPCVFHQMNLLGSHDIARFRTLSNNDPTAYHLAFLFLTTIPGAPSIYYGDELGITGGHDPGCRGAFPRDISTGDRSTHVLVKKLISLRKRLTPLTKGSFSILYAGKKTILYLRERKGNRILIAINAGIEKEILSLEKTEISSNMIESILFSTDDSIKIPDNRQNRYCLTIPARSGTIYQLKSVPVA